jgi:histone-lysine N-methyltransferase SETMAR
MNMRHIAMKFVPELLTNDQKQRRLNMCPELWEEANEEPAFISRIITGDKSWIYGYDPETKQQLWQWKSPQSPRAKKARQVWSLTMSMLIAFWCEFVPPNTTINSDFYCDILRHLRENGWRQRPELWCKHKLFLHHDNAPSHKSLKTTEFVTNSNMVIIPHPPYSPDLAPCDFNLFPKLKMKLKGQCFETVSDIQSGTWHH